jgi:hypothetical protein
MTKPDELCTLDPSTLRNVTGGLASGGGKTDQTDTQLQLALQSIKSSISDIGKTQNTGSDTMSMMLPMVMMMKQRQQG